MHLKEITETVLLLLILILLSKPIGLYLSRVLDPNEKTVLDFFLKPIERLLYKILALDPLKEQTWKEYLFSVLSFAFMSFVFVSTILAFQYYLPFNPENIKALSWHMNLNTSISFMTNTNWQSYTSEKEVSYFSEMVALTTQNFTSAATGLAALSALVRGIFRKDLETIGNFWVDIIRIVLYLLLPFALIASFFFISQGIPQNFKSYQHVETLEKNLQIIPQGPVASQESIKLLGTNGGGFFTGNSSHPYENPNPLTNFFQIVLILLIPVSQIYYFGHMIKNQRHTWCIFAALSFLFVIGVTVCNHFEQLSNPEWKKMGLSGGNLEGKEVRFGISDSALYACVTTAVSCGSVNSSHDSFTPIGGMIPMLNMQLADVIFGGVGSGLYNILFFVFLTIFMSGLIIGRTPEYLGKKIEAFDMKMTMLAILSYIVIVHVLTAIACLYGTNYLSNTGPHGFSEILYAYSSAAVNNGSSFWGLISDNPFINVTTAIAMLLGRFFVLIPVVVLAGSFAKKMIRPSSPFPLSSLIFIVLFIAVIILIGALTFFPALTLGPILEHFQMIKGVAS